MSPVPLEMLTTTATMLNTSTSSRSGASEPDNSEYVTQESFNANVANTLHSSPVQNLLNLEATSSTEYETFSTSRHSTLCTTCFQSTLYSAMFNLGNTVSITSDYYQSALSSFSSNTPAASASSLPIQVPDSRLYKVWKGTKIRASDIQAKRSHYLLCNRRRVFNKMA